ncbi:hypothetical protein GMRT_14170 [Giardia muris]|uniref:Uncharacterized protein n=1 Tax=Giardia muris TaxID=5742 RepID=A0A4Z1STF3_GIAMU|nr:hypothetical protein GMRT_14170 [Giardia muris]|eukprot:TNJ29206.1 hypothetical protein GMRT_14170 [Giardia muris]
MDLSGLPTRPRWGGRDAPESSRGEVPVHFEWPGSPSPVSGEEVDVLEEGGVVLMSSHGLAEQASGRGCLEVAASIEGEVVVGGLQSEQAVSASLATVPGVAPLQLLSVTACSECNVQTPLIGRYCTSCRTLRFQGRRPADSSCAHPSRGLPSSSPWPQRPCSNPGGSFGRPSLHHIHVWIIGLPVVVGVGPLRARGRGRS